MVRGLLVCVIYLCCSCRNTTKPSPFLHQSPSSSSMLSPQFPKLDSTHSIVGGQEVASVPDFVAALFVTGSRVGSFCGGVYLGNGVVLTAAHCVFQLSTKIQVAIQISKDVSTRETDIGSKQIDVTAIDIHEKFDPVTLQNDLALLFLDPNHPEVLSRPTSSLHLPKKKDTLRSHPGKALTVYGFGARTSFGNIPSHDLSSVRILHLSKAACDGYENFEESQLCIGVLEGGRDACQGDSGGPLIYASDSITNPTLMGIVSFGKSCAQARFPSIYTSIPHHESWILDHIKKFKNLENSKTIDNINDSLQLFCYDSPQFLSYLEKGVEGTDNEFGLFQVMSHYFKKQDFCEVRSPSRSDSKNSIPICKTPNQLTYTLEQDPNDNNIKNFSVNTGNRYFQSKAREETEITLRCGQAEISGLLEIQTQSKSVSFYHNDLVYQGMLQHPSWALKNLLLSWLNPPTENETCAFKDYSVSISALGPLYEKPPGLMQEEWFQLVPAGFGKVLGNKPLFVKKHTEDFEHLLKVTSSALDENNSATLTLQNNSLEIAVYGIELSCSEAFRVSVDDSPEFKVTERKGSKYSVFFEPAELPGGLVTKRGGMRVYHFQFIKRLKNKDEYPAPQIYCDVNNWLQTQF